MGRFEASSACSNLNHRRNDPPVAHCPQCGGVVNDRLSAEPCNEASHAVARRDRSAFCCDCGTRLIFDR